MKVAVLVCTYGSDEWRDRGKAACLDATKIHARNDRLVLAYHSPGETLAGVRNAAARSEMPHVGEFDWLCFLDADDRLNPGYFDAMTIAWHRYRHPSITDVATESGPRPTRHGPLKPYPLLAPSMRWKGSPAPAQLPNRHAPMETMNHCVIGTLVPRRLFLRVGGFPDYPIYEDWALFLKCVQAGASIVDVPDAVYVAASDGQRNLAGTPAWRGSVYDRIRRDILGRDILGIEAEGEK